MSGVKIKLSRRQALGAGVLTLGAGAMTLGGAGRGGTALAAGHGHEAAKAAIPFSRYQVGEFEVITLLDGAAVASDPQKTFGMNVDKAAFEAASADHFLPPDRFKAFFTPTLVNTGSERVLFDTGNGVAAQPGRGNLLAALASAGYGPQDIDIVVLTHMHPDHIRGLMIDGAAAFPNARYVTGSAEYNAWRAMDPESNGVAKLVAANVTPLAEKMSFLDDGGSVVSGITAMAAFGHTPGHMAFMLESGGAQLLLVADTANHYVWSLGYPEWEVRFDMDKAAAAQTRKRVFGMLAAEKIPFVGYHMPFPAVGFVEARGAGFRYVAESYQLEL